MKRLSRVVTRLECWCGEESTEMVIVPTREAPLGWSKWGGTVTGPKCLALAEAHEKCATTQ